jgi:hypothetical protein
MAYPRTGSTLGGTIKTGLSTQIIVKVKEKIVGAIQTVTINQTRDMNKVKELGTDGIIEIHPNKATEYSIEVTRIVFDKQRMTEAFGRGYINIKSQMVPFDIEIIDSTGGTSDSDQITHKLINCWFSNYRPSYGADAFVISEQATIVCEDIISVLGNSDKNAAGLNNGNFDNYVQERQTDRSKRGTMDVPGIFQITKDIFNE